MFTVKTDLDLTTAHEVLVIGLFEKSKKVEGLAAELDSVLEGQITELLKEGDISAKIKSLTKIHTLGKLSTKRIYFVG